MDVKVILQEKIVNLGNVGDKVLVKCGYARNFLFPYGKAVLATTEHVAKFEKRRVELEKLATEKLEKVKLLAKKLEGTIFHITAKASDEGKLFGSVGSREIAEVISRDNVSVEKRDIHLPEGPIRQIGEYEIWIRLHIDVSVMVKIEVLSE